MARTPVRDHRKPLQITQATWDREDEAGRKRLVIETARMGYRLLVGDGEEAWAPGVDPEAW